jgi:hypothetical protein
MVVTVEECQQLSKLVATCTTNMAWIKERLEKGDNIFEKYESRLRDLETEHSLLKSKLGAFVLGLTFFITLVLNSILWLFSYFGGKH